MSRLDSLVHYAALMVAVGYVAEVLVELSVDALNLPIVCTRRDRMDDFSKQFQKTRDCKDGDSDEKHAERHPEIIEEKPTEDSRTSDHCRLQ